MALAIVGAPGPLYSAEQPGSPVTNTASSLRIIDQLSDSTMWSKASGACSNWNVSPGPVDCRTSAVTNDSWVYFKRDDAFPAPNGYNINCDANGGCGSGAKNIKWSEIYQPIGNKNFPNLMIPIAAHEFGHSVGLAHHGVQGSNVALMTQGTTRTAPNSIDTGPLPACSSNPVGANGTGGTRCIYNSSIL